MKIFRMRILKSQSGMTLVELIAALTIMGILIPTISACIFSTMRQYAWSKSYADMCGVISVIDSTVERELTLASTPVVNESKSTITFFKNRVQKRSMETRNYTLKDKNISVLYINNNLVMDPAFYNDVSVTARFTVESGVVMVTLVYDGVVRHTSSFAVHSFDSILGGI